MVATNILVDPLSMCEMLKLFIELTYSIFCSEHCSRCQKVRSLIHFHFFCHLLPFHHMISFSSYYLLDPVYALTKAKRHRQLGSLSRLGLLPHDRTGTLIGAWLNSFDSFAIIRWNSDCSPCHEPGKWKWASRTGHSNHIRTIGYSTITIYWQLFLHLEQILEQHWTASLLLSD